MTGPEQAARLVGRYRVALVLLRSFVAIVYLSNGMAKATGLHRVAIGPWTTYLINRDDALAIQRANGSSAPGALQHLGTLVVDHWDVFQWLLTAAELAVGGTLLAGILSRVGALVGLGLALGTFAFTLGAGTWVFDYLFEPVLLAILVVSPGLPGATAWLGRASGRRSRSGNRMRALAAPMETDRIPAEGSALDKSEGSTGQVDPVDE